MNITPLLRKNHEKLGKSNIRFLEYITQHPDGLKAGSYKTLDIHDRLFRFQGWPTFISRQAKKEMKESALKVLQLIKSIPGRIFSNDYEAIGRYYGIPVNLARYFLDGFTEPDIDNLLARGDFVLAADGIKCLEYNINSNIGGIQLPLWESLYLHTPVTANFLNRYNVKIHNVNLFFTLFDHLLQTARNRFPGEREINIAIVMPDTVNTVERSGQETYFNSVYEGVLQESSLTGKVLNCEYPRLKTMGGYVFYKDQRVHSIVELRQGFVPTKILEVFKEGNILIYNGAIAWLLSTKLNLVLLSELEDSETLSSEERDVIKKHIPWTRRVSKGETTYKASKINLPSFILDNRETLVLKPSLGFGGRDIHIGRYTPGAKWKELVDEALTGEDWRDLQIGKTVSEPEWGAVMGKALSIKNWVVQEYVESVHYLYQWGENGCAEHAAVWGYYIFGNRFGGVLGRVLPVAHDRGIINAQQGAKLCMVFEVEE